MRVFPENRHRRIQGRADNALQIRRGTQLFPATCQVWGLLLSLFLKSIGVRLLVLSRMTREFLTTVSQTVADRSISFENYVDKSHICMRTMKGLAESAR